MRRTRSRGRATDAAAAHAWFRAVTRKKRCVVCKQKHPGLEAHHVIQQQVLKREFPHGARWDSHQGRWVPLRRFEDPRVFGDVSKTLEEIRWDERNGIALCPRCHGGHTSHMEKVSLERVPAAAVEFARIFGLEHRLSERFYSVAS